MLGRVKVKRILKLKFVCTLVYCSHRHTHTRAQIHTGTFAHTHTLSNWHKFLIFNFLSLFVFVFLSLSHLLSSKSKNERKKRSSNFVDVFSCFKTFWLKRFSIHFATDISYEYTKRKQNKKQYIYIKKNNKKYL